MQEFYFNTMEDGRCCAVGYRGDEAEVAIPETYEGAPVAILNDNLFMGHREITSVRIPESVREIGGFVFAGCANLKSVELPAELETIREYAFARSGLEEITFPRKVQKIPSFAFCECRKLKKVLCGANMKEICAWAFDGCGAMEELYYGPHVKVSPMLFESV